MNRISDSNYGTVDLHIHTNHSDGSFSVAEIIDIASDRGVSAISITDHDTLGAYPKIFELAKDKDIEVIVGAELSCEYEGRDIHILGYFMDYLNVELNDKLKEMQKARFHRAKKIVEKLNELGIDLRFETVLRFAGEGAIGRPHIATALVHEELAYSFKDAFDRYLGDKSPVYVEKMKFTPKEIFNLIKNAGGIPILAHPGVTKVDDLIPTLIEDGLSGIEVYHSEHNLAKRKKYADICRNNNLLFTGGSDFHCYTHKQHQIEIGDPKIRYSLLKGLKERYKKYL